MRSLVSECVHATTVSRCVDTSPLPECPTTGNNSRASSSVEASTSEDTTTTTTACGYANATMASSGSSATSSRDVVGETVDEEPVCFRARGAADTTKFASARNQECTASCSRTPVTCCGDHCASRDSDVQSPVGHQHRLHQWHKTRAYGSLLVRRPSRVKRVYDDDDDDDDDDLLLSEAFESVRPTVSGVREERRLRNRTLAARHRRPRRTFSRLSSSNLRSASTHLTATATFSHCANTTSKFSSSSVLRYTSRSSSSSCYSSSSLLVFYWHAISVLACLAATGLLCVRANVLHDDHHTVPMLMRNSDVRASLWRLPPPPSSSSSSTLKTLDGLSYVLSSPAVENPLLRHARAAVAAAASGGATDACKRNDVCLLWSPALIDDLCDANNVERLRLLRKMSIFQQVSSDEENIQLAQLFRLNWRQISDGAELHSHVEHLRSNAYGRDCLLAPARSSQCRACFHRIENSLREVDKAFVKFNATLHRFDCMKAVDSSTATRPFSPNGSCDTCKAWYRKWLLVQLVNLWKDPPCINWCYYAQLACPHLATSKVADYAGHPSFQCRDLNIAERGETGRRAKAKKGSVWSTCNCLHPCDLSSAVGNESDNEPVVDPSQVIITYTGRLPPPSNRTEGIYDYFSSPQNCQTRRRYCERELLHEAMERARSRGVDKSSTTSTSTTSPATTTATQRTKKPGNVVVREVPNEILDDGGGDVDFGGYSVGGFGGEQRLTAGVVVGEGARGSPDDEDEDSDEYFDDDDAFQEATASLVGNTGNLIGGPNFLSSRTRRRVRSQAATFAARLRPFFVVLLACLLFFANLLT